MQRRPTGNFTCQGPTSVWAAGRSSTALASLRPDAVVTAKRPFCQASNKTPPSAAPLSVAGRFTLTITSGTKSIGFGILAAGRVRLAIDVYWIVSVFTTPLRRIAAGRQAGDLERSHPLVQETLHGGLDVAASHGIARHAVDRPTAPHRSCQPRPMGSWMTSGSLPRT